MMRKCARCGKKFDGDVGFVTCPICRIPAPDHGQPGGCTYWADADSKRHRRSMVVDVREVRRESTIRNCVRGLEGTK